MGASLSTVFTRPAKTYISSSASLPLDLRTFIFSYDGGVPSQLEHLVDLCSEMLTFLFNANATTSVSSSPEELVVELTQVADETVMYLEEIKVELEWLIRKDKQVKKMPAVLMALEEYAGDVGAAMEDMRKCTHGLNTSKLNSVQVVGLFLKKAGEVRLLKPVWEVVTGAMV